MCLQLSGTTFTEGRHDVIQCQLQPFLAQVAAAHQHTLDAFELKKSYFAVLLAVPVRTRRQGAKCKVKPRIMSQAQAGA